MYYTIFKTTNNITGKYYIGKHQTKNPNDHYMGSGKHLKRAIKKYGKNNFKKEVLFVFLTEVEMNDKERELVNENVVLDCQSYNLGIGGEGGPMFKGKRHNSETKHKQSIASTKKIMSVETKAKISLANRNRKITDSFREKMRQVANEAWKKRKAGRMGFQLVS